MEYHTAVRNIVERWRHLGSRTLENGTQLIGHVPHVAPEAWLHNLFAPLTKKEIGKVEKELSCSLPDVFAEFLQIYNGLDLFSSTLSIYGLRKNYNRQGDDVWQPFSISDPNLYERPKDAKPSQLFIGGYNWDGSKLYLNMETGEVIRCSKQSVRPLNHWSDFPCMLLSETERIAKLFDESGREIRPDEPTIP